MSDKEKSTAPDTAQAEETKQAENETPSGKSESKQEEKAAVATATIAAENKTDNEKRFTQKELDELIEKRLARERKNAEKSAAEGAAETAALKSAIECFKAGVRNDCIDDAVLLASKLVKDGTDFTAALGKVLEKHPYFRNDSKGVTTGVKTGSSTFAPSDGKLRAAFGLSKK